MENKPLGLFNATFLKRKQPPQTSHTRSSEDNSSKHVGKRKSNVSPTVFNKFSATFPPGVRVPSAGRTAIPELPLLSVDEDEQTKTKPLKESYHSFFNLGLPSLKSPGESEIPGHGEDEFSEGKAAAEESDNKPEVSDCDYDILLKENKRQPHTWPLPPTAPTAGTPVGTPTGTPIGTPTRLGEKKQNDVNSRGSYKECELDKKTNKWIKNPFPNFQHNPSLLGRFRNTPYEMFREQRECEIFSAFYNGIYRETQPQIKIKTQKITDKFIFEQENLDAEISDTEKTDAIKHIFKHLSGLWQQGYILLPDAKFDNIGAKSTNDTLTIYLFDWHFESHEYSNIFEQTYNHIQWLIKNKQITRDDAIQIITGLIDALNTPNLLETLLDKKDYEDTHYNSKEFFKKYSEGIKEQSESSKNKYFALTNRGSLLNHQGDKNLIEKGLTLLKRYQSGLFR